MDRTVNEVTRVVFECPVCKSVHEHQNAAEDCASHHLEVVGLAVQYVGNFQIPDMIRLTFEDGSHLFLDWNEEGYAAVSQRDGNFIQMFGTDCPQNEK